MTKEIKSSATKDTDSVFNEIDAQELQKRGEPPADPDYYHDYDLDLKDKDDSLHRVANKIDQKRRDRA